MGKIFQANPRKRNFSFAGAKKAAESRSKRLTLAVLKTVN